MSRKLLIKAMLLAVPVATFAVPGTAFASPHHHNGPAAGSCSGTNVPVGVTYGVSGTNLPANSMVQFLVTSSTGGESSTTAMTDSNGSASVSGVAWSAGTESVAITTGSSPWSTLASCSFQVS